MTRLYRLFNYTQDRYGEPFALCDKHVKGYEVKNCVVEKIADKAVWPCNFCEQEAALPPLAVHRSTV